MAWIKKNGVRQYRDNKYNDYYEAANVSPPPQGWSKSWQVQSAFNLDFLIKVVVVGVAALAAYTIVIPEGVKNLQLWWCRFTGGMNCDETTTPCPEGYHSEAQCEGLAGLPLNLCQAGSYLTGGFGDCVKNEEPPPAMKWCQFFGRNIDAELTCPTTVNPAQSPYTPTTDPNQCSPNFSWCAKQGHCVADYLNTDDYCDPSYVNPAFAPTLPSYTPGLVDYCTWPNGDRLTVPVGMSCNQAVDDMCRRFASIPGYKGCP